MTTMRPIIVVAYALGCLAGDPRDAERRPPWARIAAPRRARRPARGALWTRIAAPRRRTSARSKKVHQAAARPDAPARDPKRVAPRGPPCANKTSPDGPRLPLFFLHVHKAGGTTFARLARDNGLCEAPSEDRRDSGSFFAKNLNPSMIDARRAIWSSARTMISYAREKRLDAWASEWFAPSELPRGGRHGRALLVVTLRDPVARVVSNCGAAAKPAALRACATNPAHYNYMTQRLALCATSWRNSKPFRSLAACEKSFLDPNGVTKGLFLPPGPRATADRWRLPPATLVALFNSSAFLDAAYDRLAAFDVVLVTERLDEAGPVLSDHLQWHVHPKVHAGTHQKTGDRLNSTLARELRAINRNDELLYARAGSLFQGLLDAAKARRNASAGGG